MPLAPARRLRNALEPLAANVYFAPEAHRRYEALGLDHLSGYFCSRSAGMGRLTGEAVTAAFAVFSPAAVVPSVERGWATTTPDELLAARQAGAIESLTRILGDGGTPPEGVERATELLRAGLEGCTLAGHPIHAGLRSLGWPGDPVGGLWRATDLLREHRGDAHNVAWVAAGVDAVEITLLTERWWGIPLDSYAWTRGWDETERAAALTRLREGGLLDGDDLTEAGRTLREDIESVTDRSDDPVLDALGDDLEELLVLVEPWARAVVEAGGYPVDPSSLGERL